MQFTLSPPRLARFLTIVVVCLLIAHLAVQTARFATGDHSLFGLVVLFSLGADGNLPTFYSSFALLLSSALLALIALAASGRDGIHPTYWFGLGAVFLFLSLDEMLELHEHLIEPLRSRLNTSGLFYYAWVIPYGLGLLLFLAVYLRFLLRLPRRFSKLFVLSGAVFVAGGMGFEMIGGWYSELHGNKNVPYVALQTVEEVLEMFGIVIFAYALAEYIAKQLGGLRVTVSSADVDHGR